VSFVIPARRGERVEKPQLADPSLPARPDVEASPEESGNVLPFAQRSSNATSS
jgi:hypothetical protein